MNRTTSEAKLGEHGYRRTQLDDAPPWRLWSTRGPPPGDCDEVDVSGFDESLLPQHRELLRASGIPPGVAEQRGYRSESGKDRLAELGFGAAQRLPGLLIPIWDVHGELATHQLRPDEPRETDGRIRKYETPRGSRLVLDVPRAGRTQLDDPHVPLFVTEGARKADAAIAHGLCCIALLGVWCWRGTNAKDGTTALPDWESIALKGRIVYLCFDSDVTHKQSVAEALGRLARFLESRGARCQVIYLPSGAGGTKVGLDDYLAQGHTVDDLLALAMPNLPANDESSTVRARPNYTGPPIHLGDLLDRIARFLGMYVQMRKEERLLCALWVAHTWVFDAWDATPYLRITSPERECGKTLLGELLEFLCFRSVSTVAFTPAGLFRTISQRHPTLIIDELDQMLRKNQEGVAAVLEIINAGYRRGKTVTRPSPPRWVMEDFDVFCPKVLIGIGAGLPDSTVSRCITVELHRKPRGSGRRYRTRRVRREVAPLAQELEAWASTIDVHSLGEEELPDDAFPPELGDRAVNVWEPLLLLARHAGGTWWDHAVAAATALSGTGHREIEQESYHVRMLAAVRTAFQATGATELATRDLILHMAEDQEAPWADWVDERDGERKPAKGAARKLGITMRRFGAHSRDLWVDGTSIKGYRRADLSAAFTRYLPSDQIVTRETRENPDDDWETHASETREAQPRLADGAQPGKAHQHRDLADLADNGPTPFTSQPRTRSWGP